MINRLYTIFLFGEHNSGVSFHSHSDSWNALFAGTKQWFLYPPNIRPSKEYPIYHGQLNWNQEVLNTLENQDKPLECIQNAGDVVFIPEMWYHATVNMGETIGVASQFVYPKDPLFFSYYIAAKLRSEKHFEEALRITSSLVLQSMQDLFQVYNLHGLLLDEQGDRDASLYYFDKAVQTIQDFQEAIIIKQKFSNLKRDSPRQLNSIKSQ